MVAVKGVVLHIGSTKTGTSSLQRYLSDQAEALLDLGVAYPSAGRRGPGQLAHHNLCYEHQISRVKAGIFRSDAGTWREALDEIDHSAARVGVISSEAFMNARPKHVDLFRDVLADREVTVVAYVRRQDHWMQSAWNQQARFGRCSLDFWEFYESVRARGRGDYSLMLAPWAESFGIDRIRVRNFDTLPSGGIVQDFFGSVISGVDAPTPLQTPHMNTMAGAPHLVAVAQILDGCRQELGDDYALATTSAIRIASFFRGRPGRNRRFSALSYESALRIHEDFVPSNERLALLSSEFAGSGGFPAPKAAEYDDTVRISDQGEVVLEQDERRFVERMTREIVRAERAGSVSFGDTRRRVPWPWRRR